MAGSVLHAVGWAHAQTLDGTDGAALAYFGDGASSQGDVHEALNFAAVLKAPVVFFVQNNGWAISLPTERRRPRSAADLRPGAEVAQLVTAGCFDTLKAPVERVTGFEIRG